MMRYATTYLLALSFIVTELHNLWANDTRIQNWILRGHHPMSIQWNMWYLSHQVLWIVFAIAMFYYGKYPNRANKISVKVFIIWTILDTWLYIYNFKQIDYGYSYLWLSAISVLFFWGKDIAKYFWKTLHT